MSRQISDPEVAALAMISARSGLCENASVRSGAPILNLFVQALPVLPSCAPSAI